MNQKKKVIQTLLLLSIAPQKLGYIYLNDAINMAVEDYSRMAAIWQNLYVPIAQKYHTSATCVERCIRGAIATAFATGKENNPLWRKYFGNIQKPPTASCFIATVTQYVILMENSECPYNDVATYQ